MEDCKESFEELKSGDLNHREQEILKNYEQTIVAFEKQPEKFYGNNENYLFGLKYLNHIRDYTNNILSIHPVGSENVI